MIKLDILSDPICPWCYIGWSNLARAMEARPNHPFTIEWHPFQLNPDMPPEGYDRKAYLEAKFGGPDRAKAIYGRIADAAAESGLDVDFEKITRTPNTMDAHRLIRWARTTGSQNALVEQLFHRYFEDGEDISDHALLLDVAESVGMEREVVEKLLSGDADRETLAEEDVSAREMGVSGVPCFIVGGRYVMQGAQPVETWVKVINELVAAAEQKMETQA